MIKQCNNCIHYNTCKDRIEFENLVDGFKRGSYSNIIISSAGCNLISNEPVENNIKIEYEMWCKFWACGLEVEREDDKT